MGDWLNCLLLLEKWLKCFFPLHFFLLPSWLKNEKSQCKLSIVYTCIYRLKGLIQNHPTFIVNKLMPEHLFNCHFVKENIHILIKISLTFDLKHVRVPAFDYLEQLMVWHRTSNEPEPELIKTIFNEACTYASTGVCELTQVWHLILFRADSRLASSQWEMSLQSNAISHWLGTNQESTLLLF